MLCCISKRFLFLSPEGNQEIFLHYLLWKSGQAPVGKSHNTANLTILVHPLWLCPFGIFNSQSFQHFINYDPFFLGADFSSWFPLVSLCSGELWFPAISSLFSSLEIAVLCPLLSWKEEKLIFFSNLFSFLHVNRFWKYVGLR